jgi:hypothetical protein
MLEPAGLDGSEPVVARRRRARIHGVLGRRAVNARLCCRGEAEW